MSERDDSAVDLIAYRGWGDPSREPLLLLHGFMGSSDDWEEIAGQMAEHFYCIAPDLPGHGRSLFDPAHHGAFFAYTQSVIDLLDTLRLRSIPAVGYSMGGRVLLALAAMDSGHLSRLVLESTTPGIEDAASRTQRWRSDMDLADRLERENLRDVLASWYDQPIFGAIKACPHYDAMRLRRLRNDPRQLALALGAVSQGRQSPLWSALPALHQSTLLVCGERDEKYRKVAQQMLDCNRRLAVATAAECSHAVHVEAPGQFARMCIEFLLEQNRQYREEQA